MSVVIWVLVALAMVAIDVLRGGSRMAFAFPAYGLLALAGVLSFFPPRRGAISRQTWWCVGTASLFFGYLLFRVQFSPEEYLARRNLYLILASLLVYFLTVAQLGFSKYRMGLVAVLLAIGVVNTVIGAVQFFVDPHFAPLSLGMQGDYGWRARGFYVSPNHLAGFLEICAILGLSVAWWSRWPIYGKILSGFSALVCLGGVLITGSRGGYLGSVCGLGVFFALSLLLMFLTRSNDRRWVIVVMIACFAAALGFGVKAALKRSYRLDDRASSMVEESGDARRLLGIRRQLGHAALKQFQLNPVFGTGSGTYLYYGRQFRSPLLQTDPIYAHNDYLQLTAEFGAVGLVGFFVFLIMHAQNGWSFVIGALARARHEGIDQSHSLALTVAALGAVAAYAAHSMLDFNLQIPANTLVVAFIFGLLASPGGRPEMPPDSGSGAGKMILRLALPALGLWLGLGALPKLQAEYFSEKSLVMLSSDAPRENPEIARQAEQDARRGLAVDPKNPELYYLLGEALLALAGHATEPTEGARLLDESVKTFEQGVRLAPQDRNLVLCLAWALDAAGRPDEARPHFLRALELDPKAAETQWAYAAHLQSRGQLTEAQERYRTAAQLGSRAAAAALLELQK